MEEPATFWNWLTKPATLAGGAFVLGSTALILCTLALNTGSEDKTSDWISAFGTAFGAAITGGALLIAAFTYRQQVADKHASMIQEHRAQANAVSVTATPDPQADQTTHILIRNDSSLPISGVILVLLGKNRKEIFQQPYYVVAPGQEFGFDRPTKIVGGAYAIFTDKKGTKWRGWFNGDLEERTPTAS